MFCADFSPFRTDIIVKKNVRDSLALFSGLCKIKAIPVDLSGKFKKKGDYGNVVFTQGKRSGSC
jgi:hypothetical protein